MPQPIDRILRHLELDPDGVADWQAYPFRIPAILALKKLEFHPSVTFLVGENGSGKSTLLEALAVRAGFNPDGGDKNFRSSQPSESSLAHHLRLARGARREQGGFFLRAETTFSARSETERASAYGRAETHEMSHGEALRWLSMNRFRNGGLFILDEPEAGLSARGQLALLARIHQLVLAESQFIISTHSPILMAYPGATIFLLDGSGIHDVRYEDTEQYALTKAFLQDPTSMLQHIFEDLELNASDSRKES